MTQWLLEEAIPEVVAARELAAELAAAQQAELAAIAEDLRREAAGALGGP